MVVKGYLEEILSSRLANGARRTRCQTKRRPAHAGAVPAAGCGRRTRCQTKQRPAHAGAVPAAGCGHSLDSAEREAPGSAAGTRNDNTATEHSAGPPGTHCQTKRRRGRRSGCGVRTEPGSAQWEAPGWQCGCGGPASDFGRLLRAHSYECDECDSGTVYSPRLRSAA
jgi:hypothetical protein